LLEWFRGFSDLSLVSRVSLATDYPILTPEYPKYHLVFKEYCGVTLG